MSTTAEEKGTATKGVTTWTIDPQHSQVAFEVKHMMFAKVRGRFEEVEGTLEIAPKDDIESSRVDVVIDAASISTGQGDRDDHLRSPDFFDVEQFPELRFESSSVERTGENELSVVGELTIRDVTREVALEVTELGSGTDPWGNERVGYSATAEIDRRDFGLTWNQALEAGGVLVGNDIRITLEIQAVEQSEDSA
ncbi:MAG: YceI family protein [Longimicrobiales bacterium]|nr:YceI family protein [Longimicrobiales bacterium]